jgi:ectoine hydroxylase-related dioxygenase (phytanoyl-CoA dioxygenase family)
VWQETRPAEAEAGDVHQVPSEDDVCFFRSHGWWVSQRILPDDVLDAALAGFARYHAGKRDRRLPEIASTFDWQPSEQECLQQNGYISLQIAEVGALVRHPILAMTAARLLAVDGIRLFHDRLIVKQPDVSGNLTALGWHTDRAYWRTCTSTAMLTAWIPFQDTNAAMGPLMVMDGSHRWGGNDWMATSHQRDLEALERRVSHLGQPIQKVTIEMRRGQVSFHHCLAVHGSAPNRSGATRIALAIHIQSAENRYQPVYGQNGRRVGHLNDVLCRTDENGDPDYTDPEMFPQLWPLPQESAPAQRR